MKKFNGIVLLVLVLAIFAGSVMTINKLYNRIDELENQVLDVFQLQTILSETGYYHGEIDGVCGTQTKAAWFSYCADKSAEKYFTPSGAPR